jgi:branched-chain amino acid transport system ATP-binding protein
MSLLKIEHLNKAFGTLVVTRDLTLEVAEGERHVIIGPNGAGKTSLINQIGGQLIPDSGRILIRGVDVTGLPPEALVEHGLARTFQKNTLFPRLSLSRMCGSACRRAMDPRSIWSCGRCTSSTSTNVPSPRSIV